jgi:hypothetical protein
MTIDGVKSSKTILPAKSKINLINEKMNDSQTPTKLPMKMKSLFESQKC